MARIYKQEVGDDYIEVRVTGIPSDTMVINFYIKLSEDEEFDFDDYIDFIAEVEGEVCYYRYENLNSETEYTVVAAGYPYGGASIEERTFKTNEREITTKPPLPDEFEWRSYSSIKAGEEIYHYEKDGQKYCEPLTAEDWMDFLLKVIEIANYKGSTVSNAPQYLVAHYEEMKPGKINAVVNLLKMLSGNMESPFTPPIIRAGDPISADYFINLQYYINDVISEL